MQNEDDKILVRKWVTDRSHLGCLSPRLLKYSVSADQKNSDTHAVAARQAKPTDERLDISELKRGFESLAASRDQAWNVLAFRLRQQMYDLHAEDIPLVYELLRGLPIQTRGGLSGRPPYKELAATDPAAAKAWAETLPAVSRAC